MEGAAGASDGTAAWARLAEPSAAPLLDALHGIDAAPAAGVIERLREELDQVEGRSGGHE